MAECSICSVDFDLEGEGGIEGDVGIIPTALCPTCLNGMLDMADQMRLPESVTCPECEHTFEYDHEEQ